MTTRTIRGADLYVEDTGGSGAPVVFSHGLLWSARMFAPQIAALRDRYRVIAYDHRGQGRSGGGSGDEVSIEDVYEDAVALLEDLGVGPVHFVGLSMGGFVALRLAARRPDLVRSITLIASAADPEPTANLSKYGTLNFIARIGLLRLVSPRVMPIMFGATFLTDPGRAADRAVWKAELDQNTRMIFRAVNGVIRRAGVEDELARIACPTLVITGEEDVAVKPERAKRTAAQIAGARVVIVPRAGHTASIENPEAVTAAIAEFLGSMP